jgi:predicted membrane protein (TIGR00267 family)
MKSIGAHWKQIKEYNKIADIAEIGRRYFAMNSFDGILTILGVLIGNFIANVQDPRIIITTGVGVSIGMGVSGIWGTYLTEEAERTKKIKELGRYTLRDLGKTKIAKAEQAATIIVSLINGISPFLAAMVVVVPFFFADLIGITISYIVSIALSFIMITGIGMFLGSISGESLIKYALKMLLAGLVCVGLILLIGTPI